MTTGFFGDATRATYEGPDSTNPLAFRHYNPDEMRYGGGKAEGRCGVRDVRPFRRALLLFPRCRCAPGRCEFCREHRQFERDSHRRYMSGAATNPNPDVFAFAAATVKTCIDATQRLGGENYVLWGGREGYETLLNTNMGQELDQLGRFLNLVVEYKHKIGFKGTILIEPKPQEPTNGSGLLPHPSGWRL